MLFAANENEGELFVSAEMILQGLVNIVRAFGENAVQSRLVDIRIIQRFNIVILCIAELHDRILQRQRSLFIGIGARYAVSAVNLRFDKFLVNVDVLLDIGDRLFMVFLRQVICLDEGAFQRGKGVRICLDRRGRCDLPAARLILECLFMCAVVNDLIALRFCK